MNEKTGKSYQICNTLATGGTAVLYKAIQTSLDRPVVIKRLHAHLISDPNFTRRFELEAKSAASLDHENIVRIIDFGSSEGNYFIVMEYIDGPSFKDILSSRRSLDEEVTLLVAHEICMGLDHAHQHGIIHRDIKPANIMITNEGQVKITDFGLAKLHQSQTQETVSSTLLGTPLYMSPEQAIGDSIDGRSDLFSLGTICYESMTGTQPFFGDNYAAVLQNIINGSVQAPSRIRKGISPEAEALVMKALHREPGKRFRSALEMARAIESLLGQEKILSARERLKKLVIGEPDAARIATPSPRRRGPRRLLPIGLAAAGIAAAAIIAVTNPQGISSLVDVFKALRESNPVPPPREIVIASQADALGSLTMSAIEQPLPAVPAAPDTTANAPVPDTAASSSEARSDTGSVLENSTRHLTLPNADSLRKAELEKAKLVKEPVLPSPRPAEPPAPAPKEQKPLPAVEPVRNEVPATGFVDIAVEPSAEISIDGRRLLFGEHLSMFELSAGMHEIACRSEGFRDYVEVVKVQRGELSRRRIALERLSGAILFSTEMGAQIFVDGVFKGTVPLAAPLAVPAGTHRVELKKPGFQSWTSAVIVPENETVRLAISLVPVSAFE
jgi:serine/threonine protein kinase